MEIKTIVGKFMTVLGKNWFRKIDIRWIMGVWNLWIFDSEIGLNALTLLIVLEFCKKIINMSKFGHETVRNGWKRWTVSL